ncbi:MAG: Asp-tRNA(Asn)/Glu-tRNA(Gln) amidotransferase subunit GatC [Sedimentisphaerales bacterium]|nr:Asp-tRNA(Asn)/Glu-tRNA(Gln) amidotransferase subunit GatC [Sedimentisphaerales bacterium]
MSEKLTAEQVRHVAKLARLACTDEEIAEFTEQLAAILQYVGQLEQVDTADVEPLAHCLPVHNVFRRDEVRPSLTNDQALANAPQRDGEFFAVPKVLDDASA